LPPWQLRVHDFVSPLHTVVSHTTDVLQLNVQLSAEQEAPLQPPVWHSNVHELPPVHAAPAQPPPLQSIVHLPPSGQEKRALVMLVQSCFEESQA
jgi:hypothetical protein